MAASESYFQAFNFSNILFASIGAAVFWGFNGRTKLRAFVLRDFIDLLGVNDRVKTAIELLVFITLGCLVGIAATEPVTSMQAMTAGFGWTGLFARPVRNRGV